MNENLLTVDHHPKNSSTPSKHEHQSLSVDSESGVTNHSFRSSSWNISNILGRDKAQSELIVGAADHAIQDDIYHSGNKTINKSHVGHSKARAKSENDVIFRDYNHDDNNGEASDVFQIHKSDLKVEFLIILARTICQSTAQRRN